MKLLVKGAWNINIEHSFGNTVISTKFKGKCDIYYDGDCEDLFVINTNEERRFDVSSIKNIGYSVRVEVPDRNLLTLLDRR